MSSDEEEEIELRGEKGDEKGDKELLFLIEFLVDSLLIKPENMNIENLDPCLLQGEICVILTFLHFPPMCICEKDLDPCKVTGDDLIKFNSGKSLMFALSESQFENPPPIYLEVAAHKTTPHGASPSKLVIGMTKICLSELFKQVFEKVNEKPDKLPLSKSIKDAYRLIGEKRKAAAEIVIYIRLSCLGQNVVTEFQRGGNECEPFLFKNKESNKIYECKAKDCPIRDESDICPPCPGYGSAKKNKCDDGGYSAGGSRGGGRCSRDGDYEEFGAEVHGHALTIKVQKSKRKETAGRDSGSSSCICDSPSGFKSKSVMSSRGGVRVSPAGLGNQIAFQVPQNQSLCKKGRNNATVCNVDSANERNKDVLQIVPQDDASGDKDVFVLRIGKKGEAYGKGKLELELRTPKQKVESPPRGPRMIDNVAQTDREEQPKKPKKKG